MLHLQLHVVNAYVYGHVFIQHILFNSTLEKVAYIVLWDTLAAINFDRVLIEINGV